MGLCIHYNFMGLSYELGNPSNFHCIQWSKFLALVLEAHIKLWSSYILRTPIVKKIVALCVPPVLPNLPSWRVVMFAAQSNCDVPSTINSPMSPSKSFTLLHTAKWAFKELSNPKKPTYTWKRISWLSFLFFCSFVFLCVPLLGA